MADILIVDDQDRYAELCRRAIPEHRYRGPARSWKETSDVLARSRGRIDLVLLDVHFDIEPEELLGYEPGLSAKEIERLRRRQGLEILRTLRGRYPDLPVILMTSREELPLEEPAERLQAEEYTYFLDDDYVDARSLQGQIDGIVAARRGEEFDGPVFWGRSLAMRRIRQRLTILAKGRLPVVLLGPTGTGKSLLARHFVHVRSGRNGRFIAVDLSTIPQDLMAAHLFGSVKGAYTGSVADRVGAFEAADGGTLFLDEVGEMDMSLQGKLLRVLQEGEVKPVGGSRPEQVDVRIIAASKRDLEQAVEDGTFRDDLYYRLNVIRIDIPPLRERRDDVSLLADYFLRKYVQKNRRAIEGISRRGLEALSLYNWPGNVRELENAIERAVVLAKGELLTEEDLPDSVFSERGSDGAITVPMGISMEEMEKLLLSETLKLAKGNKRLAAHLLGISLRTVYRILERQQNDNE